MLDRNRKKWPLRFIPIILILTLIATGCGTARNTTTVTPTGGINKPHTPPRTGDIKTGVKVDVISQSITSAGGMVAPSKSDGILDGFVIDVPPNSYSNSLTFKISYAPITSQTFGSDITPISPMISVDNGGAFSNEMMLIRVPVKVPDGYFAMGFYYDATTKQLEGMPLFSAGADYVTVGAMHFSNFFISMINKTLLQNDIDSHFLPGVDDWQFDNFGSYIARGHCEGQSLTALWYYVTQPDGPNARLYGRYDNNGDIPATPTFQDDDSLGYRFASVVQKDINEDDFANKFWNNAGGKDFQLDANQNWQLVDVPGIGDEATWNLFAYSIQATHEPQLVAIWSNAGGGHAMICYRIYEGNLYIADPNYHGNTERRIIYANGQFQPYNSGANKTEIDAGNGQAFENIQYYAKSTVLPWSTIDQRWEEFEDNTIGNDKFPNYNPIVFKDDNGAWVALSDDLNTPYDSISINLLSQPGITLGASVYREGHLLQYDAKGNYGLQPGNNKLGIEIIGLVNNKYKYIDFKYINVVYGDFTIDPTTKDGVPDEAYTFTAKAGNLPDKTRLDWFVDNVKKQSGTDLTFKTSFSVGSHTVTAKLFDAAGKETQTAEATVNIDSESSIIAELKKKTSFNEQLVLGGTIMGAGPDYTSNVSTNPRQGTVASGTTSTDIIWKGTSFTGTISKATTLGFDSATGTVSGTFSADGKTLVNLTVTAVSIGTNSHSAKFSYTISNLPVQLKTSGNSLSYRIDQLNLSAYITKFEYQETSKDVVTHNINTRTLSSPDWTYVANSISGNFGP
jgi:hypothetical protein